MGIQMVQCPNGGKCGSKSHIYSSQAFQDCQKASAQSVGFSQPQTPFVDVIPGMNEIDDEEAYHLVDIAVSKIIAEMKYGDKEYYILDDYHRDLEDDEVEDVLRGDYMGVKEVYESESAMADAVNDLISTDLWSDIQECDPQGLGDLPSVEGDANFPTTNEYLQEMVWEVTDDQYFNEALRATRVNSRLARTLHDIGLPSTHAMADLEVFFANGESDMFKKTGDTTGVEREYNDIVKSILNDGDHTVDHMYIEWDYDGDLYSIAPKLNQETYFEVENPTLVIGDDMGTSWFVEMEGVTAKVRLPKLSIDGYGWGEETYGITRVRDSTPVVHRPED